MNGSHSALLASATVLFMAAGLCGASAEGYGESERSGRSEIYGASRSDPSHYGETYRRGYHDVARPDTVYRTQGSIVIINQRDPYDRNAADGGIAFRGIDEYDGGGGYAIDPNAGAQPVSRRSGPKIIDVETARLDRRPIGASGIDVVYSGGAKIIRIAPDYRASSTTRSQIVADRQADAASERRSAVARVNDRQPWAAGWLAFCTRQHRSFDPALGTYVAADGKVRFCTAE